MAVREAPAVAGISEHDVFTTRRNRQKYVLTDTAARCILIAFGNSGYPFAVSKRPCADGGSGSLMRLTLSPVIAQRGN